jgi:hypothetical protein
MTMKQKRNADGTFAKKQPRGPDGRFGSLKTPITIMKAKLDTSGKDWYHDKVVYTNMAKTKPQVKKKEKQPQKPKGKGKRSSSIYWTGRVSILGKTGSGKTRYGLTIPYEFSAIAMDLYGHDVKITIGQPIEERDPAAPPAQEKQLNPLLLHS